MDGTSVSNFKICWIRESEVSEALCSLTEKAMRSTHRLPGDHTSQLTGHFLISESLFSDY